LAAVPRPIALLLVLALAGCGSAAEPQSTPTPKAAATPQAPGCEHVARPSPRRNASVPKPTTRLARGRSYVATVSTSCGNFEIALDPRRAPRTGGSFLYLARRHFYDGLTFHRVSPGFVIQGGDPNGDGTGGPGYTIVERPPASLRYTRGVVAMAKTSTDPPGASGSQFFVITAASAPLPPDYALVGKVTSGMDVVQRIGALPVDAQERPDQTVLIRSIRVAVTHS
jgi:cyclophilin family peptidyl-prolyl cis-trans isomerase